MPQSNPHSTIRTSGLAPTLSVALAALGAPIIAAPPALAALPLPASVPASSALLDGAGPSRAIMPLGVAFVPGATGLATPGAVEIAARSRCESLRRRYQKRRDDGTLNAQDLHTLRRRGC